MEGFSLARKNVVKDNNFVSDSELDKNIYIEKKKKKI